MTAYTVLMQFADRWQGLPRRLHSSGAILIGHHAGPTDHDLGIKINSALTADDVHALQSRLNIPIPVELREFYLRANGFSAFGGWLRVFGLRRKYRSLDYDEMVDQPVDLIAPNLTRRGLDALRYSRYASGEYACIMSDGSCFAADAQERTIARWDSFAHWMRLEIDRFSEFVDGNGVSRCKFSEIPAPSIFQ